MIVVGSRLRGNETRNNTTRLPRPLVQIDADASQAARNFPVDQFINADAAVALTALAQRLPPKLDVDAKFLQDVAAARTQSEKKVAAALGPYRVVADALQARVARGAHPFVRDVTLSNSTFGNRYVHLAAPHLGVHALGGGIGQGVAMAIGAALAGESAKAIALLGDGGTMVNLGELATAVDSKADIVFILMNDRGYGVIRNIQDAQFGGRRHYADLHTPDFGLLAAAFGLPHRRVSRIEDFESALDQALAATGPQLVEVDMVAIGPFAEILRRPAGRRRQQRVAPGMSTGSILASLRQPLRRGEVEDLRGVVVEEPLDLTGAALPNFDFSGATFNAPILMRGAVFQGLAWFTAATFNAPVDFSSAVFLSDARFEQARFHRGATFSATEFRGVACFDQAEFGDAAFLDRMTCYGNLSLDRTRFNGAASLQDSECFGGLWGNRTVFSARADVRGLEVHGRTWLVGAAVAEDASPAASSRLSASIRSFGYRWL